MTQEEAGALYLGQGECGTGDEESRGDYNLPDPFAVQLLHGRAPFPTEGVDHIQVNNSQTITVAYSATSRLS